MRIAIGRSRCAGYLPEQHWCHPTTGNMLIFLDTPRVRNATCETLVNLREFATAKELKLTSYLACAVPNRVVSGIPRAIPCCVGCARGYSLVRVEFFVLRCDYAFMPNPKQRLELL